jgi:hypothetical protein
VIEKEIKIEEDQDRTDISEEEENLDIEEIYEPTEEEIDEHYREQAEKYWENKR